MGSLLTSDRQLDLTRLQPAHSPDCRLRRMDRPLDGGGELGTGAGRAGWGSNHFGEAGQHSPLMTWQELVARDPDVIVIVPCGFDIARSRRELLTLVRRPEWPALHAVRPASIMTPAAHKTSS